jgi:hypothetical protein
VAVAWDETRDRYYFMNVSDSSICVLVPLAEAPEFTEDELLAKEAREGLGKNLVGAWSIPGTKAAVPQSRSALVDAVRNLLGADEDDTADTAPGSTNVAFERVVFAADGKCTISGGMYGQWNVDNWTWAPVRQDADKQTIDFELQTDGVAYQTFRAEFKPEDAAAISIVNGGQLMMSGDYVREAAAGSTSIAPSGAAAAIQEPQP